MTGTVEHIHVAPTPGAPPERVESVRAVAGEGLEGDRYFEGEGTFGGGEDRAITLIEAEALAAAERDYDVDLEPGIHRRNVTTRGVALNHLVDTRFRVGDAVCEGVELCEPCSYLEQHTDLPDVEEALVHRGGLRARIVETGTVAEGDSVGPISE
jgi:MOSC domain-containing protein YiiM